MLKVMKNDDFLVCLAVWFLFPKLLDKLRVTYVRTAQNKIRATYSCVANCFSRLFHDQGWQGEVLRVMKNDPFLVLLAVWVLFPKLLGRFRSGLC